MPFSTKSSLWAIGLLLVLVTDAVADSWTVARLTGKAWLVSTQGYEPLRRGAEIAPGLTIETKAGARVLLVQGETSISIGPNSVMAISALRSSDSYTTVLHQLGQIEVDVEKRAAPHFEVVTPYLAAVVKGTRFRVGVTTSSASVTVARGLVSVSDYDSGERADVGANQAVTTSTKPGAGLRAVGPGTQPTISQGKPSDAPIGTVGNDPAPGSQAETAESAVDATGEDDVTTTSQSSTQTDIGDDAESASAKGEGSRETGPEVGGSAKADGEGKSKDRGESDGEREGKGKDRDGAKSEREGESEDRGEAKSEREGKGEDRGGSKSEREGKGEDRDGSKSEREGKGKDRDGSKSEREGKGKDR